jgi:hypothetical protein
VFPVLTPCLPGMVQFQIMRFADPSASVSGLATNPCGTGRGSDRGSNRAAARAAVGGGGEVAGERQERTWGWFLRQALRSSARRPRAIPPDMAAAAVAASSSPRSHARVCLGGLGSLRRRTASVLSPFMQFFHLFSLSFLLFINCSWC